LNLPSLRPSDRLAANLARVRERIAAACAAAGRNPADVRLLPVTKSVGAETAAALAQLGELDLGENRVDAIERKAEPVRALAGRVRWHMVGHLQRNKARRAVQVAASVHSVDKVELAESLSRACAELEREIELYFEVRLFERGARSGFEPEVLGAALERAASLPGLRLRGLMGLAAPCESPREGDLASQGRARADFRALRELRDRLARTHGAAFAGGRIELSMGMSADLEAAVAEGADVVRVGTALFEGLEAGARPA
jgi:hypothetical protein